MTPAVVERRERERAARRDHILDAAERVFWREGFEAAKMGAIAEAAQLAKGTLYLYFRDKDHLALGLATRHQAELLARFATLQDEVRARGEAGLSLLRRLLTAYADHMQNPLAHLRMVMSRWATGRAFDPQTEGCQRAQENVVRIFTTIRDAIVCAQREGDLPTDVGPEALVGFLFSSVNGSLLLRLQMSCFPAPELAGDQVMMSTSAHIDLLLDACRHRAASGLTTTDQRGST
ncbi:MAG: helix-turn-helix domain-containing protein [Myxococcota bacterium]